MSIKRTLFILLLSILSFPVKAQAPQFPTPNAAAMNVFMQYPQSSFTGVPSINIPVLDFNYQGLSLPIMLSYNTNLVKPFNYGSWVGLGWNLSAGGSVTRVVIDHPDDLWYASGGVIMNHQMTDGFFFNHGYLQTDWTNSQRMTDAMSDWKTYHPNNPDNETDYETIKDYAPDEFSFNIGNLNGTFYMDDNGNWKVRCNSKIKVIAGSDDLNVVPVPPLLSAFPGGHDVNYPNNCYLNKITLIDEKGIKYIFGEGQNSKEEQDFYFGKIYTTWWISNIIFPNGKTINYLYEKPGKFYVSEPDGYVNFNGRQVTYTSALSDPSYLTDIVTEEAHYKFSRTGNVKEFAKLDAITCFNRYNVQLKKVNFAYQNTPMNRLKLTSLSFKDVKDAVNNTYTFDYNSESFVANDNTDHWGFYTTRKIGVPDFTTSRGADTAHCRAELLKTIGYPTGGRSVYTWEPNEVSKAVNNNRVQLDVFPNQAIGGVRIKQITFYDAAQAKANYKKYVYYKDYNPGTSSGTSTGVQFGYPSYDSYFAHSGDQVTTTALSPTLPLTDRNTGSHVSYSQVTQVNSDGSYITTDYSNYDTGLNNEYMDEAPISYQDWAVWRKQFTSHTHEHGFPLRIRSYSSVGGPINDKQIQYTRMDPTTQFVKAYVGATIDGVRYTPYSNTPLPVSYSGAIVKFYTNPYLPYQETLTSYPTTSTPAIKQINTYSYDPSSFNLVNTSTQGSTGDIVQVKNNYPSDMVLQNRDPNGVYADMVAANSVGDIVESIKSVNGTQTELHRTNFKEISENLFKPSSEEVQFSGNPSRMSIGNIQYDQEGNLLSTQNNAGMTTSYVYGYQNTLPIATVVNAQNLSPASTSTSFIMKYGATQTYTQTFTVAAYGGITKVALDFNTIPSGNDACRVYFQLTGPDGKTQEFILSQAAQNSASELVNEMTFTNLITGNYTITAQWFSRTNLNTDLKVALNYPLAVLSSDVYVENFEETGTWGDAHTGHRFHTGAYTIDFVPFHSNISMKIDYFYHINGAWKYASEPYTAGGTHTVLPQGADAVDDIRIYPAAAQITSYTYEPLVGITSQVDMKGLTTTYLYDDMQRLYCIKDNHGNITKQFCYNYAGQSTDCTVLPSAPVNTDLKKTIYARVEIENVTYVNTGDSPDMEIGNIDVHGDIYIRFYLNPECTIPYALPTAMDVDLQEVFNYSDQNGSSNPSTTTYTYTADANQTQINIGSSAIIRSSSSHTDPNYGNLITSDYYYSFSVINHLGSTYVPMNTNGYY